MGVEEEEETTHTHTKVRTYVKTDAGHVNIINRCDARAYNVVKGRACV